MPKQVQTKRVQRARNRQNPPRRPAPRLVVGSSSTTLTQSYVDSLNDPFDNQGPRLGWGCLVPTNVASAYFRSASTANADGSLLLLAKPCAKGLLRAGDGGAAVATTASADATDLAAISASFGSGRLISIGIRAFPSIAATSAPGATYSGALEGMTTTLMNALTPNDCVSFPQSHIGIASDGATAVGRPQDTDSFRFATEVVNGTGWATTDELPFSVPYIAFVGLPATALVYYEVVMNFEGVNLTQHSAAGLGQGNTDGDSLATHWFSVEHLWNSVRPALKTVTWNTISTVANMAMTSAGAGGTMGSYARRRLPTSRTMLRIGQ